MVTTRAPENALAAPFSPVQLIYDRLYNLHNYIMVQSLSSYSDAKKKLHISRQEAEHSPTWTHCTIYEMDPEKLKFLI